ncbi:hypothetical protein LguiA_012977 [Lonicera macranthoides]
MLGRRCYPMGFGTADPYYCTSSPDRCPSKGQSFGPWLWQCTEHSFISVAGDAAELCFSGWLSSSSPNADYLTFLKTDFFNWHPSELFDLIFDYTFFCAIEPDKRSAWASQIRDLLKASYEEVLQLIGFKAISIVENELAIGPRKLNHQADNGLESLVCNSPDNNFKPTLRIL